MRILLIVLGLLFFNVSIDGQSRMAKVHLDKPYYVTGETVWYKIYLPQGFSNISGKARVIVKNSRDVLVDHYSIQLAETQMNGYFKIPYDLDSDTYTFSIYVLENKTLQPVQLLDFLIPIYNDLSGSELIPIFPDGSFRSKKEINQIPNTSLDLEISKIEAGTREKISISGQVTRADGEIIPSEFSVSVVDEGLIGPAVDEYCVFSEEIDLGFNVVIGLDERVFLQGYISDAKTDQPAQVNILGAFNRKQNRMYYSKSGENGLFTFLMPEQFGDQNLQIAGYLFNEFEDTRIEIFKGTADTAMIRMTNQFDRDVSDYITASNVRKRIYQQFKQIEEQAEFNIKELDRLEVRPNKNYKIAEYVSFESVGAFFDEILGSQLKFDRKDDQITAKMFNPEKNRSTSTDQDFYYPIAPVFVIDGKMTKNAEFVYNLRLSLVDEIDLYYDWRDISEQFGTFGEFGYVVIRTNNADIALPQEDEEDIISITAVQPAPDYPIVVAPEEEDIPNLRPSVYWNPQVGNKNGRLQTSFTSSDDVSKFRILVVARTNSGEVLTRHVTYQTVNN